MHNTIISYKVDVEWKEQVALTEFANRLDLEALSN